MPPKKSRAKNNGFVGLLFLIVFSLSSQVQGQQASPLPSAHAHNDYLHTRPLQDALEHGFCSIEADVFLVEGQLLVAHYLKDIQPQRTLESLYLQPLLRRFQENKNRIYPGYEQPITLLVDIKAQGQAVYKVLVEQLERYSPMLSVTRAGKHQPGAVTVIISGDRPVDLIRKSDPCWVGIDGRVSDLDSDQPAWLYPLVSDNWRVHFQGRGTEKLSESEREKLHNFAKKAHDKKRKLRFWATPEKETLWTDLKEAGVDLIGTDDLARLTAFLRR
jgi:hypothetical protein